MRQLVSQNEYTQFWNQTFPSINEAVTDIRYVFLFFFFGLNECTKGFSNSSSVDKNETLRLRLFGTRTPLILLRCIVTATGFGSQRRMTEGVSASIQRFLAALRSIKRKKKKEKKKEKLSRTAALHHIN